MVPSRVDQQQLTRNFTGKELLVRVFEGRSKPQIYRKEDYYTGFDRTDGQLLLQLSLRTHYFAADCEEWLGLLA